MPTAIAILAHPDDAEFLCAGTMLRLQQEHGWEIHVVTMTAGDCGSAEYPPDEIAAIRRAEGAAACQVVAAGYHCLEELDMRVLFQPATVEKTVRLINKLRPRVIFTHSPEDYHLDHEQTSHIVRAASFAAPIRNYLHRPGHTEVEQPLDAIPYVLYCDPLEGKDQFGREIPPAFIVDITATVERKGEMLAAHESQRAWLRKHHGVDNLVESMRQWSSKRGASAGFRFGEGFRQHLGHSYPQDPVLTTLLGATQHT
jgi:LmbE family N-acetylglucosaminyl deacetylase